MYMKFYVKGKLKADVSGDKALEICKKCDYCWEYNKYAHYCLITNIPPSLETKIKLDNGLLECRLP